MRVTVYLKIDGAEGGILLMALRRAQVTAKSDAQSYATLNAKQSAHFREMAEKYAALASKLEKQIPD